jgi:hypothetical protein
VATARCLTAVWAVVDRRLTTCAERRPERRAGPRKTGLSDTRFPKSSALAECRFRVITQVAVPRAARLQASGYPLLRMVSAASPSRLPPAVACFSVSRPPLPPSREPDPDTRGRRDAGGVRRDLGTYDMLFGAPARLPSVDAYVGPLPDGADGIEFETEIEADVGLPPGRARWTGPRRGSRSGGSGR